MSNVITRKWVIRMSVKNDVSVATALGALKAEAKAINLPLARLCKLAGVPLQNVYRWSRGEHEPSFSALAGSMEKLEAALAAEKTRLLQTLTGQGRAA